MFPEIVTAGKACRAAAAEVEKELKNVKLDKFKYATLLVAARRIETCILHLLDAYKDTKDYVPLGTKAAEEVARKAAERERQQTEGAGGVGPGPGEGRNPPPAPPGPGEPGPSPNGDGSEAGTAPGGPPEPVRRDKRTAVPKGQPRRPGKGGKATKAKKGGRK